MDSERVNQTPSPNPIILHDITGVRGGPNYSISHPQLQHRTMKEIHLDSANRPQFNNIKDDYHLLENLIRYAKVCEQLNVNFVQMATSLVRAIGGQNQGRYNVIAFDYLLALPQYPLKINMTWCNMVCYSQRLFGVAVFPSNERSIINFPQFSSYNREVQELIFSYGNKQLRSTPNGSLAFDFIPINFIPHPITVTATLKRRAGDGAMDMPQNIKIIKLETDSNMRQHQRTPEQSAQPEYIQLE